MIGVELDEPDIDEVFNPRARGIAELKQQLFFLVALRQVRTIQTVRTCPRSRNERSTRASCHLGQPPSLPGSSSLPSIPELKQLIWVPIDPGSGGNSWKFGTLDNSESIVALATNFWPKDVQFVGREYESLVRFGTQWKYWKTRCCRLEPPRVTLRHAIVSKGVRRKVAWNGV